MSLEPWGPTPTPWGGAELADDAWFDDADDGLGVDAELEWEEDDGPPCTCSPTHEPHCASLQRRSWWRGLLGRGGCR